MSNNNSSNENTKQKATHHFTCFRCSYTTSVKANYFRHTKRKYPCSYNMNNDYKTSKLHYVQPIDFNNWLIQLLSKNDDDDEFTDIYKFVHDKFVLEQVDLEDEIICALIHDIKDIVLKFELNIHCLKALCLIANRFTRMEHSDVTRIDMVNILKNIVDYNQINTLS